MLNEKFILEQIEKHCCLDENLCSGTFYDQVVRPLEHSEEFNQYDWTYDSGVSKGVLIFDNLNYVIKIPFYAEWYEDGDPEVERDDSGKTLYDSDGNTRYLCFDGCVADCPFQGTQVEGFVKENEWDYCETEVLRYEVAKRNSMEDHFAKTYYIGSALGWPIYAQVRACMFRSEASYSTRSKKNYTEEERETARKIRDEKNFYLDEEWLMDFIAFWGEERMLAFIKFCDEWFIDDLHGGNLGYVDGVPCLVDYSSFDC
jgi:hypothetical protein